MSKVQLIVYRSLIGDVIYRIDLRSKYINKTDTEIQEAIDNSIARGLKVELVDVPVEFEEIIHFLIGGDRYKSSHDLDDVISKLSDVCDSLESLSCDFRMMGDLFDEALDDVKKLSDKS